LKPLSLVRKTFFFLTLILVTKSFARLNSSAGHSLIQDSRAHVCLDVPSYFKFIDQKNTGRRFLEVTTQLQLSSSHQVRDHFAQLLALSQFSFQQKSFAELGLPTDLTQEACQNIQITDVEGKTTIYQITQFSRTEIQAQGPLGERFAVRSVGPHLMSWSLSSTILDAPCQLDVPVNLRVTRFVDWTGRVPTILNTKKALYAMNPAFLDLLLAATGASADDLYSRDGTILVSHLLQITQRPIRPDVLTCADPRLPPPPGRSSTPPSPAQPFIRDLGFSL